MKTWIVALVGIVVRWFMDVFTGPRSKSRIRLEIKDEAVIAEERKHNEELKDEVRRIENEMAKLAPQITAAITASDGHRIIELNTQRRKLRDDRDTAKQRLDSFERYTAQGR